jgi:glycosyltransferase involved in cell wall biosynthesis
MKVIIVGTEKRLFEKGSSAQVRIASYGSLVEELHVIAFTRKIDALKPLNLSSSVWLYPTNSKSRLGYIFDAMRIGKALKERSISLVSVQDPFESGLAGFLVSRALKTRFHIQIHTDFLSPYFAKGSLLNRLRVTIGRWLLPEADCVRVVSERIKNSIETADIKLRAPSVVLPIYVEGNPYKKERNDFLTKEYGEFKRHVLMVGRLEPEKNFFLALRVFKHVAAKDSDAGLIIVGSGSQKEKLSQYTKELGIEKKVKFVGWQKNISDYYLSAAVFLSTSDYEGYGMTFIEAALSGLPIVTTDVGIARELLGVDGAFIVSPQDEPALTTSLEETLRNREEVLKHALKAQNNVKQILISNDEYLRRYKLVWEKCL